jgi:hypothetical protein
MSYVASLYRKFLDQPELPAVLQRRAYHAFSLEKDEEGLAHLAGHPALIQELDELLGKNKSAKVRTKWAARPNRTIDELRNAFSKEKRVTVLEVGALMPDMPDSWYALVLNANSAKIAGHVLRHENVGLKVRVRATGIFIRAAVNNPNLLSSMTVLFSGAPELHDTIASHAQGSGAVLRFVAGSQLSLENQQRVLDTAIYPYLVPATGERYNRYEMSRRFDSAVAAAVLFARRPGNSEELRKQLEQKIHGVDISGYENTSRKQVAELIEVLEADPVEMVDIITLGATSTDVAVLSELADQALADSNYDLSMAIASNKAISPEVLEKVLRLMQWHYRAALVKVHLNRPEIIAVFLCSMVGYGSAEDILDAVSAPQEVLERVLEQVAKHDRRMPDWLLESKHLRIEMLERAAFHSIADSSLSPQAVQQLMNLVTEALADSPEEAWTVFESVANSSGASLADVIAATRILSIKE